MTKEEKLHKILNWYADINEKGTKQLKKQDNFQKIDTVEQLLGVPLPETIRSFFEKFDGESGNGSGAFLGHSFIGLDEMINYLDFAKSLVKPENPSVTEPEKSKALIEKIVHIVIRELPLKKKFGFIKPKWFKVEFECGPNSLGGPYFYKHEHSSNQERKIIRLSEEASSQISALTKELHRLEIKDFNWDNLEIVAYHDGEHNIKRSFFDFDNTLPLTSTPDGTIKKKYFHLKWIPLISDHGGNYIGIDLDPDVNGTKGQVIIFGRDEEEMMVLANSWEEFLDWNIQFIDQGGEKLKSNYHLHDVYRKLKI